MIFSDLLILRAIILLEKPTSCSDWIDPFSDSVKHFPRPTDKILLKYINIVQEKKCVYHFLTRVLQIIDHKNF